MELWSNFDTFTKGIIVCLFILLLLIFVSGIIMLRTKNNKIKLAFSKVILAGSLALALLLMQFLKMIL